MGIGLSKGQGAKGKGHGRACHPDRLIVFSMLLMVGFMLTPAGFAQISFSRPGYELPADIEKKFDQAISLDLRDASVIDVVKFLSTKAGLNIIASQNVTSRVTLFLKDVSIGNAFEIILISAGLAFREEKGILYVMTDEEYTALYGEPYRDKRKIKIVQLKYTDPQRVGEILGGLKSAIGKIIMDKQTGTLVLIDTEEKINLMQDAAQRVDIPTVVRELPTHTEVFELSYNKAADLEPQAKTFLTEGVGALQFDEKSNRILVTDFPNVIEKVRKLIEAFDQKTRQVFIESKIMQIALSNQYQMGIEWQQIINEGPVDKEGALTVDSSGTFPISTTATQFGRVVVGDLGTEDLEATIDMLHTFGDTRTLASPQITVEHNQEATILVGTREAYVTSTVSQAESTTTTSESITFIDVGVSLKVLPVINKDGFVSMKISPEISSTGEPLVTANGNEIPIVDTTKASTQVTVKDGHTVLIGGLMQDNILKTVRKIPVLGDLPFFGALFRSIDDSTTKTELVIFLTPHIVGGDEPYPFSPTASGKPFEQLRKFE